MHDAVEACCVTGANLGQPLALLMLNAEAVGTAARRRRRKAELEASLAEHLKAHQRDARSARAARLPGRDDRGLDGGQRPHHADLQGQAQPHRGPVRRQLRERWVGQRKPVVWL